MTKRILCWGLAVTLSLAALGCGAQIIRVPIDPYAVQGLNGRGIKKVAVLPVVVPEYLRGQGGEAISVDITNQFMTELATRRLYDLIAGDPVREALGKVFEAPQDWLYQGTSQEALKVGREVKADGVIFGVVRRYVQANLSQTEVEIEFQLVEVGSAETVWSVREYYIGRGGSPSQHDPVTSPATRLLAQHAVTGAAEHIGAIHAANGPIEVSTISNRQIWGYSLLSAGAITTVATGYYFTLSYNAYKGYQHAGSTADLSRFRHNTQQDDQMWMIFGGASVALLGTGTYLLLTDPAREFARATDNANRVAVIPFVTPSWFLLSCAYRF